MPETAKELARSYLDSYNAWQAAMGSADSLAIAWQTTAKTMISEGVVPDEDYQMKMYDEATHIVEGSLQ